jgi:putative nucleotidyltransferase with HDIG domain
MVFWPLAMTFFSKKCALPKGREADYVAARFAARNESRREPNNLRVTVGFVDAIKRWRLAQQGLSSGKKRRVHAESPIIQALEESFWIKFTLYATFAVSCGVLVLKAAPGSVFYHEPLKGAVYGFIVALAAVAMLHVGLQQYVKRNSRVVLVLGALAGHLILVRLFLSFVAAGQIPETFRFFFIPYALAPMLHGVLLGRAVGAFSAVFLTLIGCLFAPAGEAFAYMILSLIAGIASVLIAHNVRKRLQLLQAGIYVGAITLVLGLLIGRLDVISCFGPDSMNQLQVLGIGCAAAFGTSVLTALLISGLLPIFEGMFHLTTDISWLELSDLNHRLLRRMQLEAPGTFHHSLVVAALSEAAAEKIGANAPMCRVCAYFHDVGKLKKPEYFIENQHDEIENPHDGLTPTMSAIVIIAHVKDGIDLAVKHKLNPRVIDVIQEHHGDSLVYFFYRKAQEQKQAEMQKVCQGLGNPEDLPKVEEKSFRYPGPKPGTRESAIIALADSIESASRTLKKPTPAKIRGLIDDIVNAKLQDGQLDECPLTLQELAMVKDSFAGTLRSMLHSRIDYPKDEERNGNGGSAKRASTLEKPAHDSVQIIPLPKRA